MGYREEASTVHTEARWTFWKFLPLFVVIVVILAGFGFGLKSLGIFGSTVVERKVFENSYQRSEALISQIAVGEAQLVEIEGQLRNPNLDENTRFNLQAQKSAINVRLTTARSKQQ